MRRSFTRTCLTLLAPLLLIGAGPATAPAAQMTVFTCHDPSGRGVGHDGWAIERTSNAFMFATDSCSEASKGQLMLELAANSAGYGDGAGIDWVFVAPSWGTIARYTLVVPDSFGYVYASSGEGQVAIWDDTQSDPEYDYRNLGGGEWGYGVVERAPPAPAKALIVNASCDGATGACPASTRISHVDVRSVALVLNDATIPTVSGLSGDLVSGSPVRGTSEVSFNAADSGPGVYSGQLTIDGKARPAVILNENNGWCINLGQTTDGTRSFAHPTPCAQSTTGSLSLDTTTLLDGKHTVKLVVDDAAGNATTAFNGQVTTDNAPESTTPPAITTPGASVGTTLTGQSGTWAAPAGAGSITYTYAWETCDTAGNNCVPIPGASKTTYTIAPTDVGHTQRYVVTGTDKDGSASAVSAATSPVPAQQESLGTLPGPGTGGSGSGGVGGTGGPGGSGGSVGVTVVGAGAPNGSFASELSAVKIGMSSVVKRSYRQSALSLGGRLLDSVGHLIVGAQVDALEQVTGSPNMKVIAHTTTANDGTFTVHIPRGPSRLIEIGYRAFSEDRSYAASADVREIVGAGVQLRISARATTRRGTIRLSGRVSGPIPKHGVTVALLVHYRGRWVPFRLPQTDRRGRFHQSYQFNGARGRFPFKAEVRGGQLGFPFATGYSATINVRTH